MDVRPNPIVPVLAADPNEAASATASAIDHALHGIATAIEITGVGIILVGAIIASVLFLRRGFGAPGWGPAFRGYRANLGRAILLGLELLVAADIVGTVAVTPSFQSLGVLAVIVLIRTFLSFSLEVEIEGHWPWRRRELEGRHGTGERL
ncbi:MAG TPA: DUF1622 domain-containing protein [Azospirillaceae bacterium]|nr:DUF1622 domain-containing protein [Azospirillaceae bacterium]